MKEDDLAQVTSEQTETTIGHPQEGAVAPIDLQRFCSTDRPKLLRPFRRSGYLYASNGHMLVRVADDSRYETRDIAAEEILTGIDDADFCNAPHVRFPPEDPLKKIKCRDCDGRGTVHDCPNCNCDCESCDGSGDIAVKPAALSTSLAGNLFDLTYVRRIYSLPELEIALRTADGLNPLFFRFKGGVGALMPLSMRFSLHVEIERNKGTS